MEGSTATIETPGEATQVAQASPRAWRCAACDLVIPRTEKEERPFRCPDCASFASFQSIEMPFQKPKSVSVVLPPGGVRDASGRFLPRRKPPASIQPLVAVPARPAVTTSRTGDESSPTPPSGESAEDKAIREEAQGALAQSAQSESQADEDESDDAESNRVYRVNEVPLARHVRFPSGSPAFDHFLGGGAVQGFCYLFAGPPGGGKSTQLRMRAAAISALLGIIVMIACGEESKEEVVIGLNESGIFDQYPSARDNVILFESTDPDRIIARADEIGAKVIVVDSFGVMQSEFASPGDGEQMKYAAKVFFKRCQAMKPHKSKEKITVFGVGHTNQDGSMSGPNKALHWVSFCSMIEHVDPTTLFPVDDQTRSTGTTGWRVYKGKSRGSSSLRQAFFDRDDLTGVVRERSPGTLPVLGRLAGDVLSSGPKTAKKTAPAGEKQPEPGERPSSPEAPKSE